MRVTNKKKKSVVNVHVFFLLLFQNSNLQILFKLGVKNIYNSYKHYSLRNQTLQ